MSGITTCPKCHGQLHGSLHVHERTLICPHCHTPLSRNDFDLDVPKFGERDFRRGLGLGYWVALGLVCLDILAVLWTSYAAPRNLIGLDDRPLILFGEITLLDGLVLVVCLAPIHQYLDARYRLNPLWLPWFILLSFAFGIAVVIFFGNVCTGVLTP